MMGWKKVKQHYRIEHIVQVTPQGICIGSPYVHDIIVIDMDGVLKKPYKSRDNSNLQRYQNEMAEDPDELRKLVLEPDEFEKSIPVYTYNDGEVIKKFCEKPGWPNCTHDGELMYDNAFFADKKNAIRDAKVDATLEIKMLRETIEDKKAAIKEYEERLSRIMANLARLESE